MRSLLLKFWPTLGSSIRRIFVGTSNSPTRRSIDLKPRLQSNRCRNPKAHPQYPKCFLFRIRPMAWVSNWTSDFTWLSLLRKWMRLWLFSSNGCRRFRKQSAVRSSRTWNTKTWTAEKWLKRCTKTTKRWRIRCNAFCAQKRKLT